jgi:acyl dehydratase
MPAGPPSIPSEWHVTAVNLPEHGRNPIHTDAGAQAAGFPRALVAGVSTYAYLVHPLIVAGGLDWVSRGGGEVRLRRPVFDGDTVRCVPDAEEPLLIRAVTDEPDQPRALFRAVMDSGPVPAMRRGEPLPEMRVELSGEWGSDYGVRLGDDDGSCVHSGTVHPAVWPALANQVFHEHVARGSWVHTRSIVRHHAAARDGGIATVRSVVVRRFEGSGERAVADIHIEVDGVTVATLEHEAIVALPG